MMTPTVLLVTVLVLGVLMAFLKAGGPPAPKLPSWLLVCGLVYAAALIGLWVTYGVLTGDWLVVLAVLVPSAVAACIGAGAAARP